MSQRLEFAELIGVGEYLLREGGSIDPTVDNGFGPSGDQFNQGLTCDMSAKGRQDPGRSALPAADATSKKDPNGHLATLALRCVR